MIKYVISAKIELCAAAAADIHKRAEKRICFARRGFMYNKLTETDIEEMEKEIEYRKLVVRPRLLEEVKETRAHGDLSENFEYHAAKKEKNRNESRIRFLEKMIKTARVIEDTSAMDEVGVGKTVKIYIPEDDEEETYTIVSTMRQDSLHGFISVESPMGRALMGHKTGDTIKVRVNDSYSYEAQIREISVTDAAEEAQIRSF